MEIHHCTVTTAERLTRCPCARGLELESRAGQILHSVANGSLPLQHLRKLVLWRGVLWCGAMTWGEHCKLVTHFGVIRRI